MLGASKPTLAAGVVDEKGVGERLGSPSCRAAHFSSWARSWLSSSSVRASDTFSPDFFARVAFGRAFATVGTGTTRPQSGHLPATGRSTMGTLSRRPQGQRNLRKPSPVTSFGAERRSRIRAAHLGHSIRSGASDGIFSFSPHRQVTRDMKMAWWLIARRGLQVSGQERSIRSCQQRTTKCWALAACHDRLPAKGSPRG